MTRAEFIKDAFSALGLGFLGGGRLFAAPPGWTPPSSPRLVFGAVSDTHLCTGPGKSLSLGRKWPDIYFRAALNFFRSRNVDAVVHCGDMAHRGQVEELGFHANVWNQVFPGDKGQDGRRVERLFVAGNHDVEGAGYGVFVKSKYRNKKERAKHVLATDFAGNWSRVWGMPYEPVWHRVVKGYHFFGRHFGVDEAKAAAFIAKKVAELNLARGGRPFFHLQHVRPGDAMNAALANWRNAIGFYGHSHCSAANWNVIGLCKGTNAVIQIPSCEPRGSGWLSWDGYISKARIEGADAAGLSRQVYIVRVYDTMMVVERHEVGRGGKLGPDWILPFGRYTPHSFSRDELKKQIGAPQFAQGARVEVKDAGGSLKLEIPRADGNPASRVYAYDVIAYPGDDIRTGDKLRRCVYAAGCNLGTGREPKNGTTFLSVPKSALPKGGAPTFVVRPISSLGTAGRHIKASFTALA